MRKNIQNKIILIFYIIGMLLILAISAFSYFILREINELFTIEEQITRLKTITIIAIVLYTIITLIIKYFISKSVLKPINKLIENAEKILKNQETSEKTNKKRAFKLFSAITIHNIPEGLSVGFTLGTAVATQSSFLVALMFALGIALQNFPEGLATSLPLYNCLGNKKKAFWLGTLSGIVEPIFAIAGFFLAASISSLLPWLLAFSAGAMIYVIIEELLPETHFGEKASVGTWAFMIGFVIMMILDICL